MTDVDAYHAVRDGAPVVVPADVVEVAGPDALTYLQGQLSQDVSALALGATATPSLLLDPSGKLGHLVLVARVADDRVLLAVDPPAGPEVVARLERFKLRTAATVTPVDRGELVVRWQPDDQMSLWPQFELQPEAGTATATEAAEAHAAHEIVRVEQGWPRGGHEVLPDGMPAELGPRVVADAVSFTKGCYTGQELVARVDSRGGHTPRRLCCLRITGAVVPADGSDLRHDGRPVGSITSAVASPDAGVVALGFVHRSVELPATLEVGEPGAGVRAVAQACGSGT